MRPTNKPLPVSFRAHLSAQINIWVLTHPTHTVHILEYDEHQTGIRNFDQNQIWIISRIINTVELAA